MKRIMQAAAFVSVFALIAGCEDKQAKQNLEDAKSMGKHAGQKLGDLVSQGKAAVLKAARDQAADLDLVVDDLKQATAGLSADAKAQVEEGLRTLEDGRASLKQKLE